MPNLQRKWDIIRSPDSHRVQVEIAFASLYLNIPREKWKKLMEDTRRYHPDVAEEMAKAYPELKRYANPSLS